MYISKKIIWTLVVLTVLAVAAPFLAQRPASVHAQEPVVTYNARYVFMGDSAQPAIFDTATGVYRVWSPNDVKTVSTYDFSVHKIIATDSLSYR